MQFYSHQGGLKGSISTSSSNFSIITGSASICLVYIFLDVIFSRFINKDGKKFIEKFQPEISRKTGIILKDYLNK